MRLHGIKIPHRKNTAGMAPVNIPVPGTVSIPMSMHIGSPAKVIVKKGDAVKVGQLIGEADGFMSSNIHASVSGKVQKIDEVVSSDGRKISSVVIESDGKQELCETVKPPVVNDFESFIKAVRDSGVVGLGGAGFPSFIKLGVDDLSRIDAVIINAAECEPYITSDTRTMIGKTEYIFKGIDAIRKYMKVKRFIIGIESNKPEAVKALGKYADNTDDVEIKILPSIYPQGGEKVLVFNTMKRIIPRKRLPIDVGVVVINVTTLAFIGEYLETGKPLVEKCVTLDGSAVKNPKNVIVPIGTSVYDLVAGAGGLNCHPKKVIYGGPMMGIAVPSPYEPVLKNTNAIIVMDPKESYQPETTPCISCGTCTNHCPFRLDPKAISRAYKLDDCEALAKLCVDICMECGCCSYVCPANRPLVQTNKLAKKKLRAYISEKNKIKKEENKSD